MYSEGRTKIRTSEGDIVIKLKRGVKQGDPLGPPIFNLIIELVLELIQSETISLTIGGENVAVMAFADDVMTIAKTPEIVRQQAIRLCDFMGRLEITLGVYKCKAFDFVVRGRMFAI